MNQAILTAIFVGIAVAAAVTISVTPLIKQLALRCGAARAPVARDVHQGVIPRWGGLAIYLGFMVGLVVAVVMLGRGEHMVSHASEPSLLKAIVAGGTLLILVGALDDIYELPAWPQLLAQLAAAGILIGFGIRIDVFTNPFAPSQTLISLGYWQYPITVLWVVGIINAINWIDGVDGLAAGVCAIAAGTLAVMGVRADYPTLSLIAVVLFGSCMGFLFHNFNPAKIFMGGGALFTGFVVAAVSAAGAFKVATTAALAGPLIVLGLPIFDVVFVIFRRFFKGKPIYKADKSHLHHRLLARGFSQRQTVVILYLASICLSFLALAVIGKR